MTQIKTFRQHAKTGNDGIFFVVCVNEDVQEMAMENIGRELTPEELEIAYNLFNDNHEYRDHLATCINDAVERVSSK